MSDYTRYGLFGRVEKHGSQLTLVLDLQGMEALAMALGIVDPDEHPTLRDYAYDRAEDEGVAPESYYARLLNCIRELKDVTSEEVGLV